MPNKKFETLEFKNEAAIPAAQMSIKSWIEGIGSNKDLLTAFDKSIDGSIGGLGSKTEKMYNSPRSVPLFEFRSLDSIVTETHMAGKQKLTGIVDFMTAADKAVQDLHKTYKNAPK